jgi:alpha-amylase/alpha-mannosidase (GH57 family)
MSAEPRLKVILCWHMHQPQYCDLLSGQYHLPWTYLHAIKDYTDMAAHLEAVPKARAVVNFAPILLEQIADYSAQVHGFLRDGKVIRDPLLAALAEPELPAVEPAERLALAGACLRAHGTRMIDRFPAYRRLADLARCFMDHPEGMVYVSDQFLHDLLVWYHLAWMGETVRRDNATVKALQDKGANFSVADRRLLVELIGELLAGIIDRYRNLAASGQVELSLSPYAHPIIPLLLDLDSTHEAMPNAPLPRLDHYPGGMERAQWHIREGISTFEQFFDVKPAGCWPSEGAVSSASLKLFETAGFQWVASGESVLRNSLRRSGQGEVAQGTGPMYRPYTLDDGKLACFFRDDGLSDLIGFKYSDWHADDAVANLVHHLESIATAMRDEQDPVVSIILDGENAWEHFPENGYYFLSALYEQLANHPRLVMTTFSDYLAASRQCHNLTNMVGGSWVYGTFSTWIGDKDKNRGWDMLGEAKKMFDRVVSEGGLDGDQLLVARHQLSICEGSDWFWWFGDYNPEDTVSDFERLFRTHLANLYRVLDREPPEYLDVSFTHGHGRPEHGGTMRPGKPVG